MSADKFKNLRAAIDDYRKGRVAEWEHPLIESLDKALKADETESKPGGGEIYRPTSKEYLQDLADLHNSKTDIKETEVNKLVECLDRMRRLVDQMRGTDYDESFFLSTTNEAARILKPYKNPIQ